MGRPKGIPSHKIIDLSGKRFGRLLVICRAPDTKPGIPRWNCMCQCNTPVIVIGCQLRNGHTTSCGCYRKEFRRLGFGRAARNRLFYRYKEEAELRDNLIFLLTIEQAEVLFKGNCRYCGIEPLQIAYAESMYGGYLYNGIDRKDNNIGYIIENCLSCCGVCNHMKRTLEEKEFLEHVKRIYRNSITSN